LKEYFQIVSIFCTRTKVPGKIQKEQLMKERWLYVASLIDLYSGKIVSWHADCTMTKELVLKALQQSYFR